MLLVRISGLYRGFTCFTNLITISLLPAMEAFDKEIQEDSLSSDTRVYFSWGTAEGTPQQVNRVAEGILHLEKALMEKQVRTYLYCQQNGMHNEASWEAQVPTWMRFIWQ